MPEKFISTEGLSAQLDGTRLTLTIDQPVHRNALDDRSMATFIDNLEIATAHDELRVVVIRGTGADFCSGFDIVGRNSAREARPRTASIQRRMPGQANRLIPLLLEIQLPIVCAVRGWAVGIGAQIAAAADFTVTSRDACWWYPFITRGFTPDSGSTWLLPRIVGRARARELLVLGRKLSGNEAAEWGMAHVAVDDADLDAVVDALANALAEGPTVAIGLTKSLLNSSHSQSLSEGLRDEAFAMELSSRSPDFREGLAAFTTRRPPKFEGR